MNEQQSLKRTNNHAINHKPTRVITDPKEVEEICWNQPTVTAERMRESILLQNAHKSKQEPVCHACGKEPMGVVTDVGQWACKDHHPSFNQPQPEGPKP